MSSETSPLFAKFAFFVFGVSSLSGWNAVLTALDFFGNQYPGQIIHPQCCSDRKVSFNFPIPIFIANCLTGIVLPQLANYISLTYRIAWSLLMTCVILVLLPLIAHSEPNNLGYYIILGLIFILGFLNSLQQNSCIGIASLLGGEFVGIFFVGTGASGTIICIFRIICLSIPSLSDPFTGAIVYFSVAGVWNIFCVLLYFKFTKTSYFQIINDTKQYNSEQNDDTVLVSESIVSNLQQKSSSEKIGMFQTIWWVLVKTFPVPICILMIYIQTFMMFPGLALEKSFPSDFATWGPTLLILTYNIGDTVGKYISGFRAYYTETLQIIVLLLRFGFYATFILIVKGVITGYWFPFLNLFIFAGMNGYTTGGFMQLGPEKVDEPLQKERVGFVQALSLTSGIMFGTFLALPMQKITPTN